jgi:hypothetical protein
MQVARERGIALVTALIVMVVMAGITTLLVSRTINEMHHSRDNAAIVQSLLLARAGANIGSALLQTEVSSRLNNIVMATSSTTGRWSYGSGSGDQPTPASVTTALSNVAARLQAEVDTLLCPQVINPPGSGGSARLRLHFTATACGVPLPGDVRLPAGRFVEGVPRTGGGQAGLQTYAIPFVMVATGRLGADFQRNIVIQGEYRFQVGRTSFARYAYFTNIDAMQDGRDIWFTGDTLIDGPTHTNSHFRFFRNPWFGGEVTTAGCSNPSIDGQRCEGTTTPGGIFFGENRGRVIRDVNIRPDAQRPSYTNRFGTHAPNFTQGVDWRAPFVPLPQNAQDQRAAALGINRPDTGLFFDDDLHQLELWAADANGNPLARDAQGNWTPAATHQYIRACEDVTDCRLFRIDANRVLQERNQQGQWVPAPRPFNGMIFVNGRVDRFLGPVRGSAADPETAPPALASFAEITVAAESSIRITGDLRYERPPCTGRPVRNRDGTVTPADCNNLGVRNILGVFSQGGNVLVGNHATDASQRAPDHIHVHAALMSGRGVIQVERWNQGVPRGDFVLIGSKIQNHRGVFGTFNPSTGRMMTGYNRIYTYDQRLRLGVAPPFFPTTGLDGVRSVIAFSFGQREQLY